MRELRYALRTLARNRGFAALATLTLALGIGPTAGIYAMANWLALRPVPGVEAPNELVLISFEDAPGQGTGISGNLIQRLDTSISSLSGVIGALTNPVQLGTGITALPTEGGVVGGDYFGVLGVRPARGRFFDAAELDSRATPHVVVIGGALWAGRYGSDPAILGRKIDINGSDFEVVGVTPAEFRGHERVGKTDLWFPPGAYGVLRHNEEFDEAADGIFFTTLARLREGATKERAQAELTALATSLVASDASTYEVLQSNPPVVYDDVGSPVIDRATSSSILKLLTLVAAIVLLIACANAGNLMLFRGVARRSELFVRGALGASRTQLLRFATAEGLLIGVAGGILGVAATFVLARTMDAGWLTYRAAGGQIALDGRVVAFTLVVALLAGLLSGIIPALVLLRRSSSANAGGSRSATQRHGRLLGTLMIVQVAGSVTLIAGALLFVRSIDALKSVELGFDPRSVYVSRITPDLVGYTRASGRIPALRDDVLEALRQRRAFDAVALAAPTMPQEGFFSTFARRPETPAREAKPVDLVGVSGSYFETLRMPLAAGRTFLPEEEAGSFRDASGPVILTASAAQRIFGRTDALGQVLRARMAGFDADLRVVGVVADPRGAEPRSRDNVAMFVPMFRAHDQSFEIAVRSSLPAPEVERLLADVIASVDPSLAASPPVAMTAMLDRSLREENLFLRLVGALGVLAAVLAILGLYGLTAYLAAQQRREIGIRIALGATTAAVARVVTSRVALFTGIGLVVGVAGASALGRFVEARLFGVSRDDMPSLLGAVAIFAAAALLACVQPVRSALRVQLVTILKGE